MVERGLRLLVKANRAATTGRFALGSAPVDLSAHAADAEHRPLRGERRWRRRRSGMSPKRKHASIPGTPATRCSTKGSAWPAATWCWPSRTSSNAGCGRVPTARRSALPAAATPMPPNSDVYAIGNTNLWFADEAHSQLEETRARVVAPNPTTSPRDVVRIAHLDTGYDANHATKPRFLNTALARNFVDDDRPQDATDKPTAADQSDVRPRHRHAQHPRRQGCRWPVVRRRRQSRYRAGPGRQLGGAVQQQRDRPRLRLRPFAVRRRERRASMS